MSRRDITWLMYGLALGMFADHILTALETAAHHAAPKDKR